MAASVDAGLVWTDPATALALLADRAGAGVDRAALARGFARQEDPHALLALVTVGQALGLGGRAFRGDLARLAALPLPLVLHLANPLDEADQGFVVLVGRDGRGWVFASLEGGEVALDEGELGQLWTGVLVCFELAARNDRPAGDGAVPGPGAHAGKDVDVVGPPDAGYREPTGAAPGRRPVLRAPGTPPEIVARRLGAVSLPALALGGAARLALADGWRPALAAAAWAILAVVGALASAEALRHVRSAPPVRGRACLGTRPCRGGGGLGCDGVLAWRWAAPFGLDLSALGLAFFVATLGGLALAATLPAPARAPLHAWLALAQAAAGLVSLGLMAAQLALRRFCALCMTVHLAVLAGVGAAAGLCWSAPWPPAGLLVPLALGHGTIFLLALGLLGPLGATALALGRAQDRLGWIASTSAGAAAELGGHPPMAPLPASPFILGDLATPVRLDALVDPLCPACRRVVDDLARLVERHREILAVVIHLPTRDPGPADRALRVALTAAGSPEAFAAVRDRPGELLQLARAGAAAVLPQVTDRPVPAWVLAAAQVAQAGADDLARQVDRITPTVLVDGRPWPGPLWALDLLLTCHPERLPGQKQVSPGTRSVSGNTQDPMRS